jgi:NAD(P)-dependent dehydrogenase (short-subunit alcohol dehydrogenase family)
MELEGLSAVVTGAASGIGLAIAERFASDGMWVMLADRDAERLDAAVRRLHSRGAIAYGHLVDVSDPDSVEALAAEAESRLGAVDVVVNNAGIVKTGLAWELSLEDWRQVIDVDLWGVIHGVRAFVPRMLRSGAPGHVVNVGSMASVVTHPRLGPYAAAKHGVLGLSDSLRGDLASVGAPIGVTVVMPGRVQSGMVPEGQAASEVADLVVDAIHRDIPYVFTDPQRVKDVAERFEAILRQPR